MGKVVHTHTQTSEKADFMILSFTAMEKYGFSKANYFSLAILLMKRTSAKNLRETTFSTAVCKF